MNWTGSPSPRVDAASSVVPVAVMLLWMAISPAPAPASRALPISDDRPVITRFDDLPRHAYALEGRLTRLLDSEAALADLTTRVRADIERDLAEYDIQDATTRQRLLGVLLNLDLLADNADAVRRHITILRELESKPAKRLTTGVVAEAILAARDATGIRSAGGARDPAFRDAVRSQVERRFSALPREIVGDQLEAMKGQLEIMSRNLVTGVLETQLQPAVDASGELSGELAATVINLVAAIRMVEPVKDEVVAGLSAAIGTGGARKPDIWPARSVTLAPDGNRAPVRVAIWDTGIDVSVYGDRIFVNEAERPDGTDTDGNGFVDDVHGIAYDLHSEKTPEILYPLGDAAGRSSELRDRMKGYFDVQANVSSPEATALKQHLSSLDPGEMRGFLEDLMRYGILVHGTHVAGIAVDGNPFAEILVARLTADYRAVPEPPTLEESRRQARMFRDAVEYFKAHGVRVVNMSWVIDYPSIERELELNGIGESPEVRAAMAREMFAVVRDGLREAFESAPGILFVGGSGNDDNDVSFDDVVPPAFDLPNLLIVGAVDQAGEPTGFTSFGKSVDVYANGFEVESFVPGGERLPLSGTSMASPNGVNLAAKLLAVDPDLSPADVIALITEGADRPGAGQVLVINPKRSMELLQRRSKRASLD